jgi:single-strand DNA-binding protein
MDLNKVMLIGRLTRDPEVRTTPQGTSVCTFSVATGLKWKDKAGQLQEKTEFNNIVAWRRLAEICGQYLHKGRQVYVEGRLQTRSWQDQNGVTKYRTEIVAENMIMLGQGKAGAGQGGAPADFGGEQQAPPDDNGSGGDEEIKVENIPF